MSEVGDELAVRRQQRENGLIGGGTRIAGPSIYLAEDEKLWVIGDALIVTHQPGPRWVRVLAWIYGWLRAR